MLIEITLRSLGFPLRVYFEFAQEDAVQTLFLLSHEVRVICTGSRVGGIPNLLEVLLNADLPGFTMLNKY